MIEMTGGEQRIVLESPAGLARITVHTAGGRVEQVTTQGEPAYVADRGLSAEVPDYGRVDFDLVWSGAFYAMIDASVHGFALTADEQIALTAFGTPSYAQPDRDCARSIPRSGTWDRCPSSTSWDGGTLWASARPSPVRPPTSTPG